MTAPLESRKESLLPIGTKVKPWGTISDVARLKGERYYFFTEKGVSMIPATSVEWHAKRQEKIRA